MEERKSALIEALAAKCGALLELQQAGGSGTAAGSGKASTAAGALAAATGTSAAPCETPAAGGADAGASAAEAPASAFEAAFRELRKWVDTAADEKVGDGNG